MQLLVVRQHLGILFFWKLDIFQPKMMWYCMNIWHICILSWIVAFELTVCVFVSSSSSVVPYWLWFGKEVQRQPHSTAHPLQRRQKLDWHSALCLHQCTPGHWTKVRACMCVYVYMFSENICCFKSCCTFCTAN